ncbi:hypothetical protein TNCV_3756281 [Trichonephila clavipes]|nr:hypothetical protein TNCV_3756281 [Trichonephila clavipes]
MLPLQLIRPLIMFPGLGKRTPNRKSSDDDARADTPPSKLPHYGYVRTWNLGRFNVHKPEIQIVFSGIQWRNVHFDNPRTAREESKDSGGRGLSDAKYAVDSLVVRASDSRPESLGSMPDATKYPPSADGVRAP